MKTFVEYVEQRDKVLYILESIATKAENHPQLKDVLVKEGWWDTVKNIGKGIGQFTQGAWSGGGIKPGLQTAVNQVFGPASQLQHAIGSLNKALQSLKTNPQGHQAMTSGGNNRSPMLLTQWLSDTIKELENQKTQFPQPQLPYSPQAPQAPQISPQSTPPNPNQPTNVNQASSTNQTNASSVNKTNVNQMMPTNKTDVNQMGRTVDANINQAPTVKTSKYGWMPQATPYTR